MRISWLALYVCVYLLFLYAPVLLLPIFSFNDSSIVAFPLSGFTLNWFALLWQTETLHSAVRNSIMIAAITAIVSTMLGLCAARAASRYAFRMKRGIMGLIMVPLVLPEIVVGVSLLVVILQFGFELSLWSIVLGHVLICTPFSVVVLSTAFNNLDRSLEEAAIDLGETRWSTFRLISLPLIMPGVIASLLIAFTISLDEFIIAFFLAGTEVTLPVYIWSLLRFPARLPSVLALGTILLAASLILLVSAEFIRRRGLRRTGATDRGGLF
ncbi:MAG: ABC transporter permease [Rhodobacteraceae bacterium]|nr:ABC transporter permease [Paracoccaceae bacterium]